MGFRCCVCEKEFLSEKALRGHKRIHSANKAPPPIQVCCVTTRKIYATHVFARHIKALDEYHPCGNPACSNNVPGPKSFCSSSCSVTITNQRKGPRGKETRDRIAGKVRENQYNVAGPYTKVSRSCCPICSKVFWRAGRSRRNCCSRECNRALNQSNTIGRIIKNGTPRARHIEAEVNGEQLNLDSLLELASIKYLSDHGIHVRRCIAEIPYEVDGETRVFIPDFEAQVGIIKIIIEVKYAAHGKPIHMKRYLSSVGPKKEALEKYCNDNDHEWIWLDPAEHPDFMAIYRQTLAQRKRGTC